VLMVWTNDSGDCRRRAQPRLGNDAAQRQHIKRKLVELMPIFQTDRKFNEERAEQYVVPPGDKMQKGCSTENRCPTKDFFGRFSPKSELGGKQAPQVVQNQGVA